MIARVWRGYTKPEDADRYEAMVKPELLPGIGSAPGYIGSYLLRGQKGGEEVEFVTIIFWDSLDAIRTVAGEDYEAAVVPEERRKNLSRWEKRATHFEIASVHGWGVALN